MSYPLSKCLDPERDYAELAEELKIVDQHFHSAKEQHPHRRFEYALALRALSTWRTGRDYRDPAMIADVGGAGSPFWRMIGESTIVVDPEESTGDLATYLGTAPQLSQAVFCLSVIEHVDDLDQFLYHLSCLVAPGGLLFLTMDCCECGSHAADMEVGDPLDRHHFHWMRQRMFGRADLRHVAETLLDHSFAWLGDRDLTYHGDHVYDYSFASLALVKRA